MTGDDRKRTYGLAALLVIGTIAGFLAAVGTGGASYATVATVGSEAQAYQMPIQEEDQRVRFTLSAASGTAETPTATFALYDPADAFMTEFTLEGDGDSAEAILDQAGPWVLFLSQQENAEVDVAYEGLDDEEDDNLTLEQLAVEEESTLIAEQDGGALDEQLAFRLDERPATSFLEWDGNIEGLQATVSTDEGVAFELADASANATEEGTERTGETTFHSENLVAGTYEITAQADEFAGELAFTVQTYDRQQQVSEDVEETEEKVNETETYTEEHEGIIVAELTHDEAVEVQTAGADELTFLTSERTAAELTIYDSENTFVDRVEIQPEHEDDDKYKHHKDDGEANQTAHTVDLNATGDYVIYVNQLRPSDAELFVFVANEEAEAEKLDVETESIAMSGNEAEANTTLPGAVLDISVWTSELASTHRNITVTGEEGPILHYEEGISSLGASMQYSYTEHTERFTDGEIDVTVEDDGIGSSSQVDLVYYVR